MPAKVLITPEEFSHIQAIYDKLIALGSNGTPAIVSSSMANRYDWNYTTLQKMRRHGAISYCQITDTYNLRPTGQQPPDYYFTTSLLSALGA